jgi:hypothetical protein
VSGFSVQDADKTSLVYSTRYKYAKRRNVIGLTNQEAIRYRVTSSANQVTDRHDVTGINGHRLAECLVTVFAN